MKRLLALQTEGMMNQELKDLIQYCVIIKGKASICKHDIDCRSINETFVLEYINKELCLIGYDELASDAKDYKIVTAKDKYELISWLKGAK